MYIIVTKCCKTTMIFTFSIFTATVFAIILPCIAFTFGVGVSGIVEAVKHKDDVYWSWYV
jgi:hypothetical protein